MNLQMVETLIPPRKASIREGKPRSEVFLTQWLGNGSRGAWDGLRRDESLWDAEGDCDIFLYHRSQSRRGPSIRVSTEALRDSRCTQLLLLADSGPRQSSPHPITFHADFYLGGPKTLSRTDLLRWHITTRNFFAWVEKQPLVGISLSEALSDLFQRMLAYRDSEADNMADLLSYMSDIGYLNFVDCPDHALAALNFADTFRLKHLWIDAFVHCVGMHEWLIHCSEFKATNIVTRALLARAALQMDQKIQRSIKGIHTLLEEELSRSNLALPRTAHDHLDEFRSFLQSHLVNIYGYWPPRVDMFPKRQYEKMLAEFENLYIFLADKTQTQDSHIRQIVMDGICVEENVDWFNKQQGYEPLPFTLPLLPDICTGVGHQTQAYRALKLWKAGTKGQKPSVVELVRAAHMAASNLEDAASLACPLLTAYVHFESGSMSVSGDKLSFMDARKVRWILIYGMVQLLRGITSTSVEVSDRDLATYPLCCPLNKVPSWDHNLQVAVDSINCETDITKTQREDALQPTEYASCLSNSASDDETSLTEHFASPPPKSPMRGLGTSRPATMRREPSTDSTHSAQSIESSGSYSPTSDDDSQASPSSGGVPSLQWSRDSRASDTSSDQEEPCSPDSDASSEYSVRLGFPDTKALDMCDILDKGLAADDIFICPGLAIF